MAHDCKCDAVLRELQKNNALLRTLLAELRGEDLMVCVHCGNADPEKLQSTAVMGEKSRITCGRCGRSFREEEARG